MILIVDKCGKIGLHHSLKQPKCGKVTYCMQKRPKILKTRAVKKIFRGGCGKVGE